MNLEHIAKVCHSANKAFCETLGDYSQADFENAPDWAKSSALNGVNFHLAALKAGVHKSPKESHESWMKQKREEGWTYGEIKDPVKKEHPCFVEYSELPVEQKVKDYIFSAIVKAFFTCYEIK